MNKTKIVATIGPSSEKEEVLEKLMLAGLDVARLNMSHGSHKEHQVKIDRINKLNKKLNKNVGIMLDTKGPEIRLGDFEEDKVILVQGSEFILTTKDVVGTTEQVSVTYKGITDDVKVGTTILLDDGLIELEVIKVSKDNVVCLVKNTGVIKSKKGVNIPGINLSLPALTERDKLDIKFGVENDVEYIAASFVRKKQDVVELRNYLDSLNGERIKIIAKIENEEGIDNFDEILEVADGIMVARGDMGVEVPIERLPKIQKMMIKKAAKACKLVITATQMLESMVSNPRPTRAEVSDVANAIYDGTGAIMLSGETASGSYPVECVKMMENIAKETEANIDYWNRFKKRNVNKLGAYVEVVEEENKEEQNWFRKQINFTVCSSAMFTDAKAIISISERGKTPAVLSSFRPNCPIYVFTSNEKTHRQMSLEWGVKSLYYDEDNFETLLQKGIEQLLNEGLLKKGDVVILGGGTTNDHESDSYLSAQTMGAVIRI